MVTNFNKKNNSIKKSFKGYKDSLKSPFGKRIKYFLVKIAKKLIENNNLLYNYKCDFNILKLLRRIPMSDTFDRVAAIVEEQLGVESSKIAAETDFQKDLGADSLDVVELIMAFEEEFDINVNDEAAGEIKTVQQVIDYIESEMS